MCRAHDQSCCAFFFVLNKIHPSWKVNLGKINQIYLDLSCGDKGDRWENFTILVFHITRSTQRTAIFAKCQEDHLPLADHDKIYSLVRDGGVRWNSTYMMIERVIKLRDSIDQYCFKLTRSADEADKDRQLDELSLADWEITC